MSMCLNFSGFHGKITVGAITFLGDPLVHPAWNPVGHVYAGLPSFGPDTQPVGKKETDGGALKTDTDDGKGTWLNEHGFATNELVIDGFTMNFDAKETAYIRLTSTEKIMIQGSFNFRVTPFGQYIAFRHDPQPGARENGTCTITAAGTNPGDLYKYGDNNTPTVGWQPCTLPVANNGCAAAPTAGGQEWRIWYQAAKIASGSSGQTITFPNVFKHGYKQQTFDDLQYGKQFSPLE